MDCQVTKITTPKVLHALPDAQYRTNSISPMYFEKKEGVLEFGKGTVVKTIEEFSKYWRDKSIVGPLVEFEVEEVNEENYDLSKLHEQGEE